MDKGRLAMVLTAMATLGKGRPPAPKKDNGDNGLEKCEKITFGEDGRGEVIDLGQRAMRLLAGRPEGASIDNGLEGVESFNSSDGENVADLGRQAMRLITGPPRPQTLSAPLPAVFVIKAVT